MEVRRESFFALEARPMRDLGVLVVLLKIVV